MTDSLYARQTLREMLEGDPSDWKTRQVYARLLFDSGETKEAADLIWEAPEIPSVDLDIAFAARILAKGAPRRAIRLLDAVLAQNKGRPAQSLGIANALLHHGMVMQAARFYGAAIEADPDGGTDLLNADLEHFLLWVDDSARIWGDFEKVRDKLEDLPWMKREEKEAEWLRRAMKGHTTPVRVPHLPESLPASPAEVPDHEMYVQSPRLGAKSTPPPAVTIPMDRVATKDRLFDPELGAEIAQPTRKPSQPQAQPQVARQPDADALRR